MPSVRVRENEYFDAALRRFKRACEKAGILTELRRREFYEKPTQERKRKKAAAIKRHMKRISRDGMRARVGRERSAPAASGTPWHGHFMSLKERITEDMKSAMRAGEKERLATIRLILAAIKQREVDERIQLDDSQVLAALEKMIKQRKEAITQFESGGRADLVAKESAEIAILQAYLPAQLSDAEIDALIAEAIASTGAASIKDMGKVMGVVKAQGPGQGRHGRGQRPDQAKLS